MTVWVLKFGGSVLTNEDALARVLSEIYRYTRNAHKLVVVVSAFQGETDKLLRHAGSYTETSRSTATPSYVAGGEVTASCLLTMALERSGISACYRTISELSLIAEGEALSASPVSVNSDLILGDLDTFDVVVVAGFVAETHDGLTVLLGRGGSDLTAVFLGHELKADVKLYKDVDYIYSADPAMVGPSAKPYESLSYDEALKIAFPVVQSKAMRFAKENNVALEVLSLARERGTTIGGLTKYAEPKAFSPIRLAVMGAGGVGSRFLERCLEWSSLFDVKRILVRDLSKYRNHPLKDRFTSDARQFVGADVDVFVDIGTGIAPSAELLEGFLAVGVGVTSANKQAVAAHIGALRAASKKTGAPLTFSASVGGGAPIIEALLRAVSHGKISSFCGVLNGTSNFVIDQVEAGKSFDAAMDEARRLGFAEPDSTADLDGTDVGAKLKLLRDIAFSGIDPVKVDVGAISEDNLIIPEGKGLRYVARCWFEDGGLCVSMQLEALDRAHFLIGARGEQNRAIIDCADGSQIKVAGKGAGAWPTTESLLADVLSIARGRGLL